MNEVSANQLLARLAQEGYPARIVSIRRLQGLKERMEDFHRKGFFDADVYNDYHKSFDCEYPVDLPAPKSLIIAAVPSPVTNLVFTHHDKTRSLTIPPTYIGYHRTMDIVEKIVAGLITLAGYSVAIANIPLKSLAVCSGLAAYGRNNICYVSGLGSYHELVGLYSDLPCPKDEWREPALLERCTTCTVCQHLCPTGAIGSDRILLHAEKCLTFHNERSASFPFPEWIQPAAHNAVIGCMSCQQLCPENRQFTDFSSEAEQFSHTETDILIRGLAPDLLPPATRAKLTRLDLMSSLNILPRNLKAAFEDPA